MELNKDKITLENSSSVLDEREQITMQDRSHLVREHDFGRIESANAEDRDIPVYAIIEYDKNGQVVYEDYSKLDEVLFRVITNNIKETHIKNPVTNQQEVAKTIQGNVLTKLRLSEKEMEYAITYLTEKNILVRGVDSSLDSEFDGYQFICTYKSESLPPALSNDENIQLFRKLKQLKKDLSVVKDEEQKLLLEKQMYKIRERLIEGNMRLTAYIMYKQVPPSINDIDKEDIKQIGYETLIKFIDRYDVDKGYALSTGLYNYLMFNVWRNYNDLNLVRIPVSMQDRIKKVLKVKNAIEPILEREATPEEIAEELYLSVGSVEEALDIYNRQGILSIDDLKTQREEDEQLYDLVLDDDYDDELDSEQYMSKLFDSLPELVATNTMLREKMEVILDTLTETEAKVLKMRFGFDGGEIRTLEEVGKHFGLSRERIRQIELKAIRKLRHPSRVKIIKDFYGDNDIYNRYLIDNPNKHKR